MVSKFGDHDLKNELLFAVAEGKGILSTALLEQGYSGQIYPVNPRADEIAGLKSYPSVAAIPGPVDVAIVLVPQSKALDVVRECATKGVKGAVLFTAGFSETGTSQGQALLRKDRRS